MSDAQGSGGRRVVVLGGTSEIALAIVPRGCCGRPRARSCSSAATARGWRRPPPRSSVTAPLRSRRSRSTPTRLGDHEAALDGAFARLGGGADLVLLAVGVLGERGGLPASVDDALTVLRVNVVGAGSLLIRAARALREQRSGTIVVLSLRSPVSVCAPATSSTAPPRRASTRSRRVSATPCTATCGAVPGRVRAHEDDARARAGAARVRARDVAVGRAQSDRGARSSGRLPRCAG